MPRKKRRDAIENRERLLDAAFELLAERDPDLTVRELAVHTGLGIGTAYRHFATHEDLIRALYDRGAERLAVAFMSVSSTGSAWDRLAELMDTATFAIADLPALRSVMRRMYDLDPEYDPGRGGTAVLQAAIEACEREGSIRPGITGGDLAVTGFALAGLVGRPTERERSMLRRHLAIFLDGLHADGPRSELPPLTMTAAQFRVFMHRSHAPAHDAAS